MNIGVKQVNRVDHSLIRTMRTTAILLWLLIVHLGIESFHAMRIGQNNFRVIIEEQVNMKPLSKPYRRLRYYPRSSSNGLNDDSDWDQKELFVDSSSDSKENSESDDSWESIDPIPLDATVGYLPPIPEADCSSEEEASASDHVNDEGSRESESTSMELNPDDDDTSSWESIPLETGDLDQGTEREDLPSRSLCTERLRSNHSTIQPWAAGSDDDEEDR
jgi:hypothetical protein